MCLSYQNCIARGFDRYSKGVDCFEQSRFIDINLQIKHLERLAEREGLHLPDGFVDSLLPHLQRAHGKMERPFEFSIAYTSHNENWLRFSLAMHDDAPEHLTGDIDDLLALVEMFPVFGLKEVRPLLQDIPETLVKQLLFGIDLRKGECSRIKFYLRLAHGMAAEKRSFFSRVLPGLKKEQSPYELDSMELIGVSLYQEDRIPEIKAYFSFDGLPMDKALAVSGKHPFLCYLSKLGRRKINEMLLVRKSSGDGFASGFADIDIKLPDNDIGINELLGFLIEHDLHFPMRSFVELYKQSSILPTFVTFSVDPGKKMNLYYLVLDESSPLV